MSKGEESKKREIGKRGRYAKPFSAAVPRAKRNFFFSPKKVVDKKKIGGEKMKRRYLTIPIMMLAVLTLAAFTAPASAGQYGDGCPFDKWHNGTVHGGIYLKTVGSYGTSLNGTFYDVPDGRKITMLYFGIWEGSRGKTYNFTITINENPSDTYYINDSAETNPWCDAIDESECHVSITGCGVNFVSYNATSDIVNGTNNVSISLDGDVYPYQTTLFVVYENTSMPEIQYWVKEGQEYPDAGEDFYLYFNETVNTGRIYTGSIESLKYWTIGFPHGFAGDEPPCGWPTLNGNCIDEYDYVYSYGITGSASEVKPPKCYAIISRWDNISSDYITAPNNLFYYCNVGEERLMVPILMLQYGEPSDLNVTDISPESICVDYYNSIDATIVNNDGTAHSFNVTLYANNTKIDAKQVTNLSEGENTTVKFFWKPNATGSYVLNVTADVENVVNETNETNNSKAISVEVKTANPPSWSNQSSNVSTIPNGGTIELSAQGIADVGLDNATLATNETETWENITDGRYGSPMDMSSYYNYSVTHTTESDWKAQTLENVTATEDVKLYQSVGTTNLAYNKTAYAKNYYSTRYPNQSVDGLLATSWESDSMIPPNGAEPNWWYVDLGEVTTIRKIYININNDAYGPFLYNIYISSDNETWTKKKEESAATSKTYENLDWSCRYINITYLENQGEESDYAGLTEFEAYGPGNYSSNGTLTSSTIETSYPIVAVTPTWNATNSTNNSISVNISVDDGTTWEPATNNTELTWDYNVYNTSLKYRVLFNTSNVSETPVLHDISLNYTTRDPVESEWRWSNFTWHNTSVTNTTVGWKIYYKDMLGKTNCTDVKTFHVGS
jgi:hypothetical protein